MVRALFLSLLLLTAASLPSEAAKRTVHLFDKHYAFNFPTGYAFIKREDQEDGKRETVYFADKNRSIIISASEYDPEKVGTLLSREAFTASMLKDNSSAIKYVNDETPDGRLGSHLLGACDVSGCLYKMQSAIGQKIWLSVFVACDECSDADGSEAGRLADQLYRHLRAF